MKRASFLASSAAVTLTGCGGHHVVNALPGVASSSPQNGGARFTAAEPIPDSVINMPIVGEVRRFDGAVSPSRSWMLAQGQQLNVADNPHLFSILRTVAGGDGKSTFALPKPRVGYIIAIAGIFPTSPAMLAQSGRHMVNHNDSLGDGARAAMPRIRAQRPALIAEIARRPKQVAAAPPRWTPLSGEAEARIADAERTSRADALANLSPSNRSLIGAVTDAVAGGSMTLVDAVRRMQNALGPAESAALLAVNDRMMAAYRPGLAGASHPNPALEAARFLVAAAFTPEQLTLVRARG